MWHHRCSNPSTVISCVDDVAQHLQCQGVGWCIKHLQTVCCIDWAIHMFMYTLHEIIHQHIYNMYQHISTIVSWCLMSTALPSTAWARMTASFLSGVVWPQMNSSWVRLSFPDLIPTRTVDKVITTIYINTTRKRLLQMSRPIIRRPSLQVFIASACTAGI